MRSLALYMFSPMHGFVSQTVVFFPVLSFWTSQPASIVNRAVLFVPSVGLFSRQKLLPKSTCRGSSGCRGCGAGVGGWGGRRIKGMGSGGSFSGVCTRIPRAARSAEAV